MRPRIVLVGHVAALYPQLTVRENLYLLARLTGASPAALGVDLPSVTDPDGRLQGALRAPPVLPMTFVLRADGSVVPVDPPRVFRSADQVRGALVEAGVG